MNIEKEMFAKAVNFFMERYAENKASGVAVLRLENGEYLISIWPDVKCAISTKDNSIIFKSLKEKQPYYWLDKK